MVSGRHFVTLAETRGNPIGVRGIIVAVSENLFIFADENQQSNSMCTRTIHINDSLMEQIRPMFPNDEDLQLWLEKQMESVLINYSVQHQPKRPCSYTDEEMYAIVKERLQSLENGTAQLIDGEEVFSQIRKRYGFKASMA